MRKILQILLLLITQIGFAQIPQHILKSSEKITKYDKYAGSIYINNKFEQSTIIDESSKTYEAKLNYNIFTDAIEYETRTDLFELSKNPTTYARINNDYYYYCNFKTRRGAKRNGYYVLMELNDTYRIYKRFKVEITDPEEKENMPGSLTMGKIKMITKFYLEENQVIVEIPTSKKELLLTFEDKGEELKDYMKKEKIKLRKEEDLLRLVAKYNALKNMETNPSRSLLSSTVRNN
ncbi:hypothetical protein M0D21_12620 [Aquimarina sp. D1M17]|uniref:hypothetical protein n=1 Tax=Aquimarina acroporae TaxID=2937283 RepID=UPI0020C053AD|nr:hypothetical protein [Aquimarina acroporae]MCK8522420.1 hypothetical protein [Aquimarina acroporae]